MSGSETLEAFSVGVGIRRDDVQQAYARRIEEAIQCAYRHGHGQLFIEGETGVGKTLGYLIPVILNSVRTGDRAIISTHTIGLQHQIMRQGDMDKALDAVEAVTGRRPTVSVRVGRRNFVDPDRVQDILDRAMEDGKDSEYLDDVERFLDWARASKTGEIREYLESFGMESLPENLTFDDVCLNSDSSDESRKHFLSQNAKARKADIVVINHATLVYGAARGISFLMDSSDPRKFGVLVADECDRLPDVAKQTTARLLPVRSLAHALEKLNGMVGEGIALEAIMAANSLANTIDQLKPSTAMKGNEAVRLVADLPYHDRTTLISDMAKLLSALIPLDKGAANGEIDIGDDVLAETLADHVDSLSTMLSGLQNDDGIMALRWSPVRGYPAIVSFRMNPSRILKNLWNSMFTEKQMGSMEMFAKKKGASLQEVVDEHRQQLVAALILTSATVSAPTKSGRPDFSALRVEFGIFDTDNPCAHLHESFSPAMFGNAEFVVPDPGAPSVYLRNTSQNEDPDCEDVSLVEINPEWATYAASMLAAAKSQGGNVLALTNSYKSAVAICSALAQMGVEHIEHIRGTRLDGYTAKIKAANGTALFISPAAWEGFDLKQHGVSFRHIVITQLPYQAADSAYNLALRRKLEKAGKKLGAVSGVVYAMSRNNALRRFRQGFGRGIRRHQDAMKLWVADPRFPAPDTLMDIAPIRTINAHPEFVWAIPRRFRSGAMGSAYEDNCTMFLRNGEMLEKPGY